VSCARQRKSGLFEQDGNGVINMDDSAILVLFCFPYIFRVFEDFLDGRKWESWEYGIMACFVLLAR
jgi:hypothetical protein